MPVRLLFRPDYYADPIWDADRGGMIGLDTLPVSEELRAQAREWNRRWERLALADQEAEDFDAGMSNRHADPVAPEAWAALERDGRMVWQRLQADLGDEYLVGWAYAPDQVEWSPGEPPERRV